MCHGKYRRYEERMERERGRRLWDLFDRETREPAPPTPMAETDMEPDPDREEVLTGAPRRADD